MKKYKLLKELGLDQLPTDTDEMGVREEFDMVREKYPQIPRTILLKEDVLRRGVTFTSSALKAIQDLSISYHVYILFQWHKMDETSGLKIPESIIFRDGTYVSVLLSPPETDPYTIDIRDGEFWLFSEGEPLEEVFFDPAPRYFGKRTSRGRLMEEILGHGRRLLYLIPVQHCYYWNEELQCKYCDMNYIAKHQLKIGRSVKLRKDPEDVYEAVYEALQEKGRHQEMFFTGGTNPRNDFQNEIDFNIELVKEVLRAVKDATGDPNHHLPVFWVGPPLKKNQYITVKEAGFTGYGCYFEIWGKEKFELVCPGKAKYCGGFDGFLERSLEALEVFGRGNVCAGFVPGIEMAPPPYGFSELNEGVESALQGYKFLFQKGFVPTGTNWSISPGSYYYKIGAAPPPLEFFAKYGLGRQLLLVEYGKDICSDMLSNQCYATYPEYQRLF